MLVLLIPLEIQIPNLLNNFLFILEFGSSNFFFFIFLFGWEFFFFSK